MEKLNCLLNLMAKYNDVFSEEVSYEINIKKIDKITETETELLNRVFQIKAESQEKHNGNLIKVDNWEKLLYYNIQDWSTNSFLHKVSEKIRNNQYFKPLKEVKLKIEGWQYGEPSDESIVKNPISDFFVDEFIKTFNKKPICAYQIESDPDFFYACYWEDYLFEFDNFYIHFHYSLSD